MFWFRSFHFKIRQKHCELLTSGDGDPIAKHFGQSAGTIDIVKGRE